MFPNCYTLFHNSQNIFQTFSTKGATESIFTRFDLENILSRLAFETGTVNNNLIINSKSLQPLLLGAVTILRHVARYETPTSAGLRPATLLKKRLWHRCFPVNFAKFLRTPFSTEHLRWLLLFPEKDYKKICLNMYPSTTKVLKKILKINDCLGTTQFMCNKQ